MSKMDQPPQMYLHDAIEMVIKEHGAPLHPDDIVAEVNRRGLHRMRDGRPIEKHQIHTRVSNYPHLFTREGSLISLVEWRSRSSGT